MGQNSGSVMTDTETQQTKTSEHKWAIVLHGGAGIVDRATMDATTEAAYRASLTEAINAGAKVLDGGGASLDAVEAAIRILEDDPLFNAGRGADFAADGRNELDAAIMDGATLDAGAVADVTRTRHPISLARAVMEKSAHVLLSGAGADAFSVYAGLEQVEPSFFFTERRWQSLVEQLEKEGLPIPERPAGTPPAPSEPVAAIEPAEAHKFGTVGAVALDRNGNLAAATSTGGTQAKRWGRVGDSPLIGAGNYADNASCAVSATGSGEYFIRTVLGHEISSLMKYRGLSAEEAAREAVHGTLKRIGGEGGVIVVDREGNIALEFNSEGMFRGARDSKGRRDILIY